MIVLVLAISCIHFAGVGRRLKIVNTAGDEKEK
jgi:hypothetical protein